MFNLLLNIFFPKFCLGCKKSGSYFCLECIQKIPQKDLICPICKKLSIGGVTHPVCKRQYSLDGLWFLGSYQDSLKLAIQKLKYHWVSTLALDLVDLTIDYWARFHPLILEKITKDRGQNWLVIPVPLHPSRQKWRGFNQSSLLAQLFAEKLGLEYAEILIRTKKTKPQVFLPADERKSNIKGAFALNKRSTLNANILLIDDVWTTGATLKECCFVLKRGGAKYVWALTLAR